VAELDVGAPAKEDEMKNTINVVRALRQRASLLSSSACAEYTRIHEAEERLTDLVREMSGLAEEAVEVMRDLDAGLIVLESDLSPAVPTITLMTQILKYIMDLSETVEKVVQSHMTTGQDLAKAVGEAAQGSACIVSHVAALSRAIKTALPNARGQSSVETELASLTAQLHEVRAHFAKGPKNKSAEGQLAAGCSLLSKSSFVN
jgi:methyl-accepting chemotaxis protein